MNYRPDIDGLRSLAVLPVILFHAGVPAFQGGYVGVDIFFVISGFLITSILIKDIEAGSFSILQFYERRIRRIIPALFFVMLVTLPFAYALLLPNEMAAYGKSLIATPLFASNFLFWSERGYFGAAVDLKPLVHTWSLAVEEQFYIFFPPLLAFLLARSRKLTFGALSVIFIVSLVASWYVTRLHFETAFYLPFTRIWELLVGSACAFYLHRGPALGRGAGATLAAGGLALLLYAIFAFDNATVFPGLAAAVPVGGAAMLIVSGQRSNLVSRTLALRPLVGIGLISYPLYLWHQPVFAYLRHMGHEDVMALLLSLPLVFGLSFLTYRYVETPIRFNRGITRRTLFRATAWGSGAFVLIGALIVGTRGFELRYSAQDVAVIRQFEHAAIYSEEAYNAAQYRAFDASPRRKVVIAGDSHARDFYNVLREAGLEREFQFSTKRINAECGNVFVARDLSEFIPALREERCKVIGRLDHPKMAAILREADEIWLVARWYDWVIDLLPETIRNLETTYGLKVRVFGAKHFGTIDLKQALQIPEGERVGHLQPADPYFVGLSERIRATVPAPHLTELLDPFCQGDHRRCRVFTDEGLIVTIDGGHLTQAGAVFLAPTLRSLILSAP